MRLGTSRDSRYSLATTIRHLRSGLGQRGSQLRPSIQRISALAGLNLGEFGT
jgi:hypothetical protein